MQFSVSLTSSVLSAFTALALVSCGLKSQNAHDPSSYLANSADGQSITIALAEPLHRDVEDFIKTLRGESKITENQLSFMDQLIPVEVSSVVKMTSVASDVDEMGDNVVIDDYRAVDFGERIIVLKNSGQDNSGRKTYVIFDSIPDKYLTGKSLEERTNYFLNTKYYEPRRIENINGMLDSAEFVFHFIPGYSGAEKTFYGSEDQQLWGVVQMVGDAATLGLGSKVMAVKKAAVGVVTLTATARVGHAAAEVSQGKGNLNTGIDAAIAVTEIGLAAFTMVKIKIGPTGGTVGSLSEARVLQRPLQRSADDILKTGISPDEYKGLAGQLGRKLDDIQFDGWKPRLEDGAPISKQGMANTGFLRTSQGDVFTQNSFTKHLVERGEKHGMSRFGHTPSADNAKSVTASASLSPMDQLVMAIKIRQASKVADRYMEGAKLGRHQWGKMQIIEGIEVIMSPVGNSGPLPVLQHYRPLN